MSPATGGAQGGLARVATPVALLLAVVAVAYLLLSSGDGTRYRFLFQTGGQLVEGNEVLIGGQPSGSVESVELTDDAQAEVTISVDEPLHEGTEAVIRSTSLSGVANRYVSLSPGPGSSPVLPDGAVIAQADTTTPVDLDQLFNTLRAPARRALRDVIQGSATIYAGRGEQANAAYKYLNPALSTSSRLLRELTSDQRVLTDFLVDGSRLVTAVAERRDDLSSLVSNANTALGAVAEQNEALDRSLAALPPTLRQANTTFVNLRLVFDDLDPLVETSKSATRDLAPFLRRLRIVAGRGVPVFRNLRLAVNRKRKANDLAEFMADLKPLRARASTAFPRAMDAMVAAEPVLRFARPFMPDLLALLGSLGRITGYYDADGHYARVSPVVNLFRFEGGLLGNLLGDLIPIGRSALYDDFDTGIFRRCPGAASQPAVDGSSPFLDGGGLDGGDSDCTATDVPPGP